MVSRVEAVLDKYGLQSGAMEQAIYLKVCVTDVRGLGVSGLGIKSFRAIDLGAFRNVEHTEITGTGQFDIVEVDHVTSPSGTDPFAVEACKGYYILRVAKPASGWRPHMTLGLTVQILRDLRLTPGFGGPTNGPHGEAAYDYCHTLVQIDLL
ncbi:hypothetical protein RA280_18240 [Cupriavidus sp. CV2]|uniref:hypothetical protein n=1 Tax=Cupriavidus ulmosensis TaxID=3065913 RepID=UPI00296B03D2|nr:hypothetical protein [Cupriavidus sp. CV2]MDW3683658.1 hypothetical protein [Cupriavidus sp. CV2]